jgi:hypothetical protein
VATHLACLTAASPLLSCPTTILPCPGACPTQPHLAWPADLFCSTAVLQKYGRVLVVLPYVSIVNEKSQHLEEVLRPMQASVRGFFGAEEKGQALAPRWVVRVAPCSRFTQAIISCAALRRAYTCMPLSRCYLTCGLVALLQGRDGGSLHN